MQAQQLCLLHWYVYTWQSQGFSLCEVLPFIYEVNIRLYKTEEEFKSGVCYLHHMINYILFTNVAFTFIGFCVPSFT